MQAGGAREGLGWRCQGWTRCRLQVLGGSQAERVVNDDGTELQEDLGGEGEQHGGHVQPHGETVQVMQTRRAVTKRDAHAPALVLHQYILLGESWRRSGGLAWYSEEEKVE